MSLIGTWCSCLSLRPHCFWLLSQLEYCLDGESIRPNVSTDRILFDRILRIKFLDQISATTENSPRAFVAKTSLLFLCRGVTTLLMAMNSPLRIVGVRPFHGREPQLNLPRLGEPRSRSRMAFENIRTRSEEPEANHSSVGHVA